MPEFPVQFNIKTQSEANPEAVISTTCVRFTVLTSRMIRLEFSPVNRFEDRPSQIAWYRLQPLPTFDVHRSGISVEVITDNLHLRYIPTKEGEAFSQNNLSIVVKATGSTWQFGQEESQNLKGTLRTLDGVDGQIPLDDGLLSRAGWHVIDDSHGLVFNQQGWLEDRGVAEGSSDLYFLGYGHDYQACIKDYYQVSGPPALVPRWVLGNWWSRYWEYTQQDLQNLMLEFKAHEVPLSVCIIDMDWHLTKIGNQSGVWTGYTWNRELFSDPQGILKFLHEMGLKSALNLHPALGVYPHEEMYPQMARAMGIDPASQVPVQFEIENPEFAKSYFEILHHPQEEQIGIDFWWMDWQQGNPSKLPGLNLLWWINHLHFLDLGRDHRKRSFIFSRWGGLGNQRYPIGFSGDSVISWDSLGFQPYLTATAANVGFGWWSHDIGGHMSGITDAELYTRWVQTGVFSPVMRLHSTKNPFLERRPWGYDTDTFHCVKSAMQLRHALIPYLYSMAWRDHNQGIPLTRPMYHLYPEVEQAYACPNQYAFGSELLVAPFLTPKDADTRLSRQVLWLPEGTWFNFFTDHKYSVSNTSGEWFGLYGELDEIPVFAKAGAILPLGPNVGWGGISNPEKLILHIYPGADNQFNLYEDDGETPAYQSGSYSITRYCQTWKSSDATWEQTFTIDPVQGNSEYIPARREYELRFKAIQKPSRVKILLNGKNVKVQVDYSSDDQYLRLAGISLTPLDSLAVILSGVRIAYVENYHILELKKLVNSFRLGNDLKSEIFTRSAEIAANPLLLATYQFALTCTQMRALVETLLGAGIEQYTKAGEELLIVWNNTGRKEFSWLISGERLPWGAGEHYRLEQGNVPVFQAIRPGEEYQLKRWRHEFKFTTMIQVDFASLLRASIIYNPKKTQQISSLRWS